MDTKHGNEWARPASDLATMRLADLRRRRPDNDASDGDRPITLPEGVFPQMLSVIVAEEPLSAGSAFRPRTFIVDHLTSMALALSLIVSMLTAVTTLSITRGLPGPHGSAIASDAVPATQPSVVPTRATIEPEQIAAWWEALFGHASTSEGVHFYYSRPGPVKGDTDR